MSVVVSTLMEVWQIVKSGPVKDGTVNDILCGLPIGPNKLADLAELGDTTKSQNEKVGIRVMADNVWQIRALESSGNNREWSVFVKVDHGGKRAGLPVGSDALRTLLSVILNSPVVSIFGFYSHAGDSYASTTPEKASSFLTVEMRAVNSAAMMALSMMSQMSDKSQRTKHRSPFILSVGSTRTAHNVPSTDSPAAVIARGMN